MLFTQYLPVKYQRQGKTGCPQQFLSICIGETACAYQISDQMQIWSILTRRQSIQAIKGGDSRLRTFSAHKHWWRRRKWIYWFAMSADDCRLSTNAFVLRVHQLHISLISNSSRVKLSFKASVMSFPLFASKKLNQVFNTCFVNEIRYQKTPARVFRFLVNAEQAGKRSSNLYICLHIVLNIFDVFQSNFHSQF